MTTIFTRRAETPRQPVSLIQSFKEDAIEFEHSNSLSGDSSSLGKFRPSNLIAKRSETIEFRDLITKKLKTESTTISEKDSDQLSATSKKSSEDSAINEISALDDTQNVHKECSGQNKSQTSTEDEKERVLFDSIQMTVPTRSCSYDSQFESLPQKPANYDSDSYYQLQQALSMLNIKLLEKEGNLLESLASQFSMALEPLYIPPLLLESPFFNEALQKNDEKIQIEMNPKKLELDFEISYGPIEFPFLSISAPFAQENNSFFNISQSLDDKNKIIACQDSPNTHVSSNNKIKEDAIKKQHIRNSLRTKQITKKEMKSKIIINKNVEENKKKVSTVTLEQLREEKMLKNSKPNDRTKPNQNDKGREKQTPFTKNQQQHQQEDLYSYHFHDNRKHAARKLNKWQVAQAEKLKDIEIPPQVTKSVDEFFEGRKKKSSHTRVGPDYQVDVSIISLKSRPYERRKPLIKWNPSFFCEGEIEKFLKKVEVLMNCRLSQEAVMKLIIKNDHDLKKTFANIKNNKRKLMETLLARVSV